MCVTVGEGRRGGELDPRAGRLRAGRSCGVDGLELVETGYDLALLAFLAFPLMPGGGIPGGNTSDWYHIRE